MMVTFGKIMNEELLMEEPWIDTDAPVTFPDMPEKETHMFDIEWEVFNKKNNMAGFIEYLKQIFKGRIPITDKRGDRIWFNNTKDKETFWNDLIKNERFLFIVKTKFNNDLASMKSRVFVG